MYSRHDPAKYYARRSYAKRAVSQVWARVNESLRSERKFLYKVLRALPPILNFSTFYETIILET